VIKPKKLFLRGFLLRVPKVRFVVISVHISDEDDMLMEDGMIYPWDGALDVGEQLFFLKMDLLRGILRISILMISHRNSRYIHCSA
jgi:hypothetical protein